MPLARRAHTDPVLYYQTQDKWVREYWVHVEYMKLLKDEVRNCYRREGGNHYENCRDLVQEYYKRTKAPSALRPRALAHARIPPLRSLLRGRLQHPLLRRCRNLLCLGLQRSTARLALRQRRGHALAVRIEPAADKVPHAIGAGGVVSHDHAEQHEQVLALDRAVRRPRAASAPAAPAAGPVGAGPREGRAAARGSGCGGAPEAAPRGRWSSRDRTG